MTPSQRTLAREALGLPNADNRSAGNYATVHADAPSYAQWQAMEEAKLAYGRKVQGFSFFVFELTRAGAEAALEPHERLDLSDFPPIGAH